MVERLRSEQRKSRVGGHLDNVATVLFKHKSTKDKKEEATAVKEMEDEVAAIESEAAKEVAAMEEQMEAERKKMLGGGMSGEEVDRFMEQLKRQEEARRKAINDQVLLIC